jgi:hypothetical protein
MFFPHPLISAKAPAMRRGCLIFAATMALAGPALARDGLGVFDSWGAFRDPQVPRCYAIAMAQPSTLAREYQPYADVGTWPVKALRNQVHFRLSRRIQPGARIALALGGQRFQLTGGGGDAWPADARMNAAIIAAMRSAGSMTVASRDAAGRSFSNTYPLAGAASAIDAAAVGCATIRR